MFLYTIKQVFIFNIILQYVHDPLKWMLLIYYDVLLLRGCMCTPV